jgi:F-type H+-transporting ATPase subunit epsilon
MDYLRLKVITPKKIVLDEEIISATVPTSSGEVTILPHHAKLFSIVTEGIIKIKKKDGEDYFSVGGGFLETDGKELSILVSRAYGQDEIDEKLIARATEQAKKILSISKDGNERAEALSLLRRSFIDSKLIKKRKSRNL